MPFFDRNRIFTIYKRAKLNNETYLYWVEKDSKKINGRFFKTRAVIYYKQFEK